MPSYTPRDKNATRKNVFVQLDEEILELVDLAAVEEDRSRSNFLQRLITQSMRAWQVENDAKLGIGLGAWGPDPEVLILPDDA